MGLLAGWRRANVTGARSREEIVEALVGDSLGPARRTGRSPGRPAAAGSTSAPAPVCPASLSRSRCRRSRMTLLEATRKKCEFLAAAVAAAGLAERVHVVCARSERYAAASPSTAAARQEPGETAAAGAGRSLAVVVARALAPLAVVVELGGAAAGAWRLASWRARRARRSSRNVAAGEAAAAACGLALRDVSMMPRSPPAGIQPRPSSPKVDPAPGWLPRPRGMAAKRPLG